MKQRCVRERPSSTSGSFGAGRRALCARDSSVVDDATSGARRHLPLRHVRLLPGYFFDFARTTVVGQDPDDPQRALIEGAIAAVNAGVQALHPGCTFGDAYRAAAAALEETEIQMAFPSFGHNLGLGIESPWLTPNNPAVIVSNMHVAVEAIVTVAGIGTAVHEENVLVTPDGPEVLSTVSVRPWT